MDIGDKILLGVFGAGAFTALALAPIFGVWPAVAWVLALAMLTFTADTVHKLRDK